MPNSFTASSTPSIAIIGASYAGLTLANVLQNANHPSANDDIDTNKNNNTTPLDRSEESSSSTSSHDVIKYSYTIFEASPESTSQVIGDFFVPSYPSILKELGLSRLIKNDDSNTSHTDGTRNKNRTNKEQDNSSKQIMIQRQELHRILKQKVQTNICYNQRILQIDYNEECQENNDNINNNTHYYCYSHNKKYGPFTYIIGADGVLSTCRSYAYRMLQQNSSFHGIFTQINNNSSKRSSKDEYHYHSRGHLLLVGDARWAQDRWYDFGFTRIKSGADTALNDGIELGKLLLLQMRQTRNNIDSTDTDNRVDDSMRRFCAWSKARERMKQKWMKRSLVMLVIAIFIRLYADLLPI